jgi:hypothetical protein
MVNRDNIYQVFSIIAFTAAMLFLQAALFVIMQLDTSRTGLPSYAIDNAINMKEVGVLLAGVFGLSFYFYARQKKNPAMKALFGIAGLIFLISGVKIIFSGLLMTWESLIGAVFVVIGINFVLNAMNKKFLW